MDGVEIIEAGPERIDAVEPLWLALAAHHGALTPAELPVRAPEDGWPMRRERYRQALEDGAVLFLAEVTGDGAATDDAPGGPLGGGTTEALGYAFARLGSAPEALAIERPLEVETVAVLPAARGRGIGTALMDAVDAWARERGIGHLTLAVRTNNDDARRLYERRGFRSVYETMYATLERHE
ncbi:MAG TPA: GNAT family N-acetyltransferase [Solirubrobacterales bacterium]|jgi:ribosomal protein S18 acetylase RimI-like enzyme|nr:GNAT family N-acetyltransferase [Solirubrobacterales bacterium]